MSLGPLLSAMNSSSPGVALTVLATRSILRKKPSNDNAVKASDYVVAVNKSQFGLFSMGVMSKLDKIIKLLTIIAIRKIDANKGTGVAGSEIGNTDAAGAPEGDDGKGGGWLNKLKGFFKYLVPKPKIKSKAPVKAKPKPRHTYRDPKTGRFAKEPPKMSAMERLKKAVAKFWNGMLDAVKGVSRRVVGFLSQQATHALSFFKSAYSKMTNILAKLGEKIGLTAAAKVEGAAASKVEGAAAAKVEGAAAAKVESNIVKKATKAEIEKLAAPKVAQWASRASGKLLPLGIGAAIGGAFAAWDWIVAGQHDPIDSGLSVLSGAASMLGPLGTFGAIAIDTGRIARQVYNELYKVPGGDPYPMDHDIVHNPELVAERMPEVAAAVGRAIQDALKPLENESAGNVKNTAAARQASQPVKVEDYTNAEKVLAAPTEEEQETARTGISAKKNKSVPALFNNEQVAPVVPQTAQNKEQVAPVVPQTAQKLKDSEEDTSAPSTTIIQQNNRTLNNNTTVEQHMVIESVSPYNHMDGY